jgi:hypothetical protein
VCEIETVSNRGRGWGEMMIPLARVEMGGALETKSLPTTLVLGIEKK